MQNIFWQADRLYNLCIRSNVNSPKSSTVGLNNHIADKDRNPVLEAVKF